MILLEGVRPAKGPWNDHQPVRPDFLGMGMETACLVFCTRPHNRGHARFHQPADAPLAPSSVSRGQSPIDPQ